MGSGKNMAVMHLVQQGVQEVIPLSELWQAEKELEKD
jgi:hypothetical protein